MTQVSRYSDIILGNVRDILWAIKERGGKVSNKFIAEQMEVHKGEYPAECIYIALTAIGKLSTYTGNAKPEMLEHLASRARNENGTLIHDIAVQRQAMGK